MANKEIFSKHIKSNVKLATRYDAEGREVQVSVNHVLFLFETGFNTNFCFGILGGTT